MGRPVNVGLRVFNFGSARRLATAPEIRNSNVRTTISDNWCSVTEANDNVSCQLMAGGACPKTTASNVPSWGVCEGYCVIHSCGGNGDRGGDGMGEHNWDSVNEKRRATSDER